MRRIAIALFLFFAAPAFAQTCSPFMGIGNVQVFDNSGVPGINAVLYSFQAGTSVQQATFSDSSCTVQNVNPITFGTGGRAAIWLVTANQYKFVLCAQNDGSSCSGGDILFSVDSVPGGVTGGGGGASAPFITNSANPATSGILRLATGDAVCWRNTANSANLCFTKDTNDLLSWAGGSFKEPEVGAPTSVTGFDILYADSTAHRYKQCSNGVACAQIANAGVDISATDGVTALHFGATQETLSSTAPTTGQVLQFNGTNIIGTAPLWEGTFGLSNNQGPLTGTLCTAAPFNNICNLTVFTLAHTLVRFTYIVNIAAVGCGTNAVIGVRDITSSTNLFTSTVTGAGGAFVDSGVLSTAMTAGHTFGVGLLTAAATCGTTPQAGWMTMVYE